MQQSTQCREGESMKYIATNGSTYTIDCSTDHSYEMPATSKISFEGDGGYVSKSSEPGSEHVYTRSQHKANSKVLKEPFEIKDYYKDVLFAPNSVKLSISPSKSITKIKLILTLEKFKKSSIDYSLISDFFDKATMKLMRKYPDYRELGYTLREMLVYDRIELRDSAACYENAISRVRQTSHTDFSVMHDVIESLSAIICDTKYL